MTTQTYEDPDLLEPTVEIKISAGAAKTLNALLAAADDYAFMGSMDPEVRPDIEARYQRMIRSMRRLIAKLEAK